ncbi:glycosyltransferase [Luteimicrobium sp. DT211]|uniref:glycosyltransferase n=1 Tax=Luteimicrobium sp. DT211 TaxID=3393412 RepID=UPI003CE9C9D8
MSRARTPILIDLSDRALASAAARRLRTLGFPAAARADDAPDAPPLPRHPSLVVADPHTAVDLWNDDVGLGRGVDVVGATALEDPAHVVAHVLRRAPELPAAPHPRAEDAASPTELVAAIEPFVADGDGPGQLGSRWVVLVVRAFEMARIAQRYGPAVADRLADHLLRCVDDDLPGVHPVGFTPSRDLVVVLDRQRVGRVSRRLEGLGVMLARRRYGSDVAGEPQADALSLTPLLGYASLRRGARAALAGALAGADASATRLDLEPTKAPDVLTDVQVRALLGEPDPPEAPAGPASTTLAAAVVHVVGEATRRVRDDVGRTLAWTRRPGVRLAWQAVGTFAVGTVVPYLAYVAFDRAGLDLTNLTYPLVVAALVVTTVAIVAESMLAVQEDPLAGVPEPETWPRVSAVIAAYLPNESATIESTIAAFRRLDYPGELQVVLAYNTPQDLPVEDALRAIAAADPRVELLRVEGSTSKAQNVNAALQVVTGEVVGLFDADHHPGQGGFQRAVRWIGAGYDVVQGHCVVRNGDASGLASVVAVEFESIYAVSHPGRARLHGFGIFGGSNGFWRTDVLRAVRMRPRMLTEDIDASMRALESGARLASDPRLTSYELATTTVPQLTAQRLRWAQGWLQVSVAHLRTLLASPRLTLRQKLGATYLLGWREVYPWISLQVLPILVFAITHGVGGSKSWFISLFVLTSLATTLVGPLQTLMAYVLGEPSVRAHRSWFWRYLLWAMVYTEFKSALTRIAHVKELTRERVWRVTPRDVRVVPSAAVGPLPVPAKAA